MLPASGTRFLTLVFLSIVFNSIANAGDEIDSPVDGAVLEPGEYYIVEGTVADSSGTYKVEVFYTSSTGRITSADYEEDLTEYDLSELDWSFQITVPESAANSTWTIILWKDMGGSWIGLDSHTGNVDDIVE